MKKILFFIVFLSMLFANPIELKNREIEYICSDEQRKIIQDYLYLNDTKYINYFFELNGKIIVEEKHISKSGNDVGGEIIKTGDYCVIYLTYGYIEYAINHEFGHLVDCYNGKWSLSSTDEFWDIYIDEKDFFNDYNAGSTNECFAQSYKYYVEDNYYFKKDCPKLWNYIDKIVKGVD